MIMKKGKWKKKLQAQFLKKVSDLLDEGYSLNDAISFTMIHVPHNLKEDLRECVQRLTEGNSIRTALEKIGFHQYVLSYLYFAEQHGDIKFAFKESSVMLEKQLLHIEKAKQILRYPIFLIMMMVFILYTAQTVIAPQFVKMYESMNLTTSFFLFLLLSMFDLLKTIFLITILSPFFIIPYYHFVFRKYPPTKQQNILVRIPIIGKGLKIYHSYYFSSQMSYLLKGGLSIFESLTVFCEQNLMPFYQEEARFFMTELKKGERLDEILAKRPFFEAELSAIVHHGQASGKLDRELFTYSQMLIERIEQKTVKVFSYVQPLIFLIIGILVLAVYLSIMLPMYQMMEKI